MEFLLSDGENLLEILVADKSGNVFGDTLIINLPAAALHKSMSSSVEPAGDSHARSLVFCPDDGLLYATIGRYVVVFDATSLIEIGKFTTGAFVDQLNSLICTAGDPTLYVTYYGLGRFDRTSRGWLSAPQPVYGSYGVARSPVNATTFYLAEAAGFISVIDIAEMRRTREIPLSRSEVSENEVFFDLVATTTGKLYATRALGGGILSIDPVSGAFSAIALDEPNGNLGRADAIELSADGLTLFAAMHSGSSPGIVAIDVATDLVTRRWITPNDLPQSIAISPGGRTMFIATQDRDTPSHNILFHLDDWRELARFPRPRPPGTVRVEGGVTFHSNGKLIFVGTDLNVDVYLNRV